MNVPTYEQIKPYIEQGLVSEQSHPEDPDVRIFNYTQKAQYSGGSWDDVTRQCRGLVLNIRTGEVLARPFPKFFNYQEHLTKPELGPVPSEVPVITEKLDGSLGIFYELNGVPWIATRGSFMSEQAVWATKWWRENMVMCNLQGFTYLFEILYPENRIVVNYDYSGLVHIATILNATGETIEPPIWQLDLRAAKVIPATSLAELEKLDEPNSEGFVAYYPKANIRIKLKFPEYVRLHKLITGVSEIAIWEVLRDGGEIGQLLEKVPDEFFKWVCGVHARLMSEYAEIMAPSANLVQEIEKLPTRKEQALVVQEKAGKASGVVFSLLDGDEEKARRQVWRMVRPRGNLPFKADIDL